MFLLNYNIIKGLIDIEISIISIFVIKNLVICLINLFKVYKISIMIYFYIQVIIIIINNNFIAITIILSHCLLFCYVIEGIVLFLTFRLPIILVLLLLVFNLFE